MPSLLPELIQTPARNSGRKNKFVKVLNHSVITFANDKYPEQKNSPRVHNEMRVKNVLNHNSKQRDRNSRKDIVNPIYLQTNNSSTKMRNNTVRVPSSNN